MVHGLFHQQPLHTRHTRRVTAHDNTTEAGGKKIRGKAQEQKVALTLTCNGIMEGINAKMKALWTVGTQDKTVKIQATNRDATPLRDTHRHTHTHKRT